MQATEAKLTELSCADFTAALAARTATPGGGGAAALAGALGMALGSMAAAFTRGKRAFAHAEADLARILDEADAIRVRLVELVDADADAYAGFTRAHALAATDPLRPQVLEAATTAAAFVPIETMRQCARALELLEELEPITSAFLISDVGCGATLAAAALRAASLNVFVNTRSLSDHAHASELEREADRLLDTYVPRADALADRVAERIRKGA